MPHIELLDQMTIDKIAAGEVIERPASVVKELVENAIDSGATAIVVEIEDGGITSMRIKDNGCGIEKSDVRNAFLRHSTSKIRSAEDLFSISSLGFRGEALSSIAAVSRVEMVTKPEKEVLGTRYVIEGGKERELEDAGAPNGTTFWVRQLFYNTPARRKFLRTPMTEASHISELLMRLALSHPEISFEFINNRQQKLHTSGNGKLRDVIYHIYGRDVANELLELEFERNGVQIRGFLGKPLISRGNRNFENYFVNGRYIKSNILAKAIEDGYKDFSMQHKYPFVAFHITMDQELIDINVHPTKMELRFRNQQEIYNLVYEAVSRGLHERELIPEVEVPEPPVAESIPKGIPNGHSAVSQGMPHVIREDGPGYGSGTGRGAQDSAKPEERDLDYFMKKMRERVASYHNRTSHAEVAGMSAISPTAVQNRKISQAVQARLREEEKEENQFLHYRESRSESDSLKCKDGLETLEKHRQRGEEAFVLSEDKKTRKEQEITERTLENIENKQEKTEHTLNEIERNLEKAKEITEYTLENDQCFEKNAETDNPLQQNDLQASQLDLFEEKFLNKDVRQEYKIIGQVFDTYWLVQFHDSLYIIDQHAAHERVLYEKTLAGMKNREYTSQYISPPIILSLTMQEEEVLKTYGNRFSAIGFEIEPFGGEEYAVRAVPDNLFGIAKKELLLEMLDMLSEGLAGNAGSDLIDEKIASMSCKAAVKGNSRLSTAEVDALIGELLTLENPYHCPHGRPTIIAMTKKELEKKFKRIV
ncbi:DNA mismatch repair endonuclease MutL [Roseburia hominis]